MAQQSNARRRRVRDHNAAWSKGDAWKDTRGGFNPDVFKDVDDATRQRLRDHQVGPSVIKGDKVNAVTSLNTGAWGDGVHGEAGAINHMYWGGEKGEKRAHNRGNVQQAVWETGLSNIGNKDQLNQFLDRADSVKAEHGDFLKDGWTSEAIMLMREQPQQAQAQAPQEAAPAEPTQPSQELLASRSRWDRSLGRGSVPFNPTGDGIADAANYGNRATDDYVNRFVPHLNAQANLESHEMGGSGNYHMNRFEGEPTELASSDIKDLYKHYSQQIQGIA